MSRKCFLLRVSPLLPAMLVLKQRWLLSCARSPNSALAATSGTVDRYSIADIHLFRMPQRVDRRSLFDRRYPPVPAVLALCPYAAPGPRHLPELACALRPHDGAAGGAEDAE